MTQHLMTSVGMRIKNYVDTLMHDLLFRCVFTTFVYNASSATSVGGYIRRDSPRIRLR